MPEAKSALNMVVRWLAGGLLLGALVAVPQPAIICRCGAELPHTHAAWGFDPHHHFGEVVNQSTVSTDEAAVRAFGDQRLSPSSLTLYIDPTVCFVLVSGQTCPRAPLVIVSLGLVHPPDPPPPRIA